MSVEEGSALLLITEVQRRVRTASEAASIDDAYLLHTLCTIAADLCGAQTVLLWRFGADGLLHLFPRSVGLASGEIDDASAISCPVDSTYPLGEVVHSQAVIAYAEGEGGQDPDPGWRLGRIGQAAVAVPFSALGASLGALVALAAPAEGPFTRDAVIAARAVGLLGAAAWERLRADREGGRAPSAEAERLRAAASRAQELERLKSNFLNVASHELRGPLAVISGYASMLGDGSLGVLPSGAARIVPMIEDQAEHMSRLVDQLLDTARLEEGRLAIEQIPCDLREVVAIAVERLRPRIAERRPFSVTASGDSQVLGDPERLATVVSNLVMNALKYTPEESPVSVAIAAIDRVARVTVTDCGPGIAVHDVPRLFTRFGRIVTPLNSHILGTGLGLHLSREIALMHGGDITVKTADGQGSAFTLTLPLLDRPAARERGATPDLADLDLRSFSVDDAVRCSEEIRAASAACECMEEAAQAVVDYLRRAFVDRDARSLVLVRCFVTQPYSQLPDELRGIARAALGVDAVIPGMQCLTLLGTAGERSEWCDRRLSRHHQAIPLQSEEAVAESPMISQLILQLGIETQTVVGADASLLVDVKPQAYNVFHVEDAVGSPHIPDQQGFVIPYEVRSVVGVGGWLPSGHLAALIMFSRTKITRETAERFRAVAHGVRSALGPFPATAIFASEDATHAGRVGAATPSTLPGPAPQRP